MRTCMIVGTQDGVMAKYLRDIIIFSSQVFTDYISSLPLLAPVMSPFLILKITAELSVVM